MATTTICWPWWMATHHGLRLRVAPFSSRFCWCWPWDSHTSRASESSGHRDGKVSQYFIHCAFLRLSSQSLFVIHSHCLSGLPIFNSKFTFYTINIKLAMFGKSLSAGFPRWGGGEGGLLSEKLDGMCGALFQKQPWSLVLKWFGLRRHLGWVSKILMFLNRTSQGMNNNSHKNNVSSKNYT